MNSKLALLAAVMSTGLIEAPVPGAPVSGERTFYLHTGSTYETGCTAPCTCPAEPATYVHGSFDLRLASLVGNTYTYDILDVDWKLPKRAELPIIGTGTYVYYEVGFAQSMALDLAVGAARQPEHLDSGLVALVSPLPTIDITVSMVTNVCFSTVVHLRASTCKADWNNSGTVTVQDIFDFLADWFKGNGDFNGDGTTSVQDIFDFLADWFTPCAL